MATKLLTRRRSPYPIACILTFILIEIESRCFHSTNEIVCCTHCSRDLFLANCCHQLMTWHCIWSRVLHSICWYCGLLFHKLFIRKFYLLFVSLSFTLFVPLAQRELAVHCVGIFDYDFSSETETRTCTSQSPQKLRATIWAIGLWNQYCPIQNAFDSSFRSDYTKLARALIGQRTPSLECTKCYSQHQTTVRVLSKYYAYALFAIGGNYAYAVCTSHITTVREKW